MTRPDTAAFGGRPDPSAALEAAGRAAAERMKGLPVCNEALRVEALGFRRWEGQWLGVVVTPWYMNLTLAPCDDACWTSLPVGGKRKLTFPAGVFEFIAGRDEVAGEVHSCSLFSPMQRFADAEGARAVALAALEALFDAGHAEPEGHAEPSGPVADAGSLATGRADAPGPAGTALSKRDFLRGRLGSSGTDGRG